MIHSVSCNPSDAMIGIVHKRFSGLKDTCNQIDPIGMHHLGNATNSPFYLRTKNAPLNRRTDFFSTNNNSKSSYHTFSSRYWLMPEITAFIFQSFTKISQLAGQTCQNSMFNVTLRVSSRPRPPNGINITVYGYGAIHTIQLAQTSNWMSDLM